MARLDLPTSPRTSVFRAIVQILRNDPVLSATCRTILAWEGKPTDGQPLTLAMAPALRITPANGPNQWTYPEAFRGDLYLNVEVLVSGYDYDDLLNLWWAVQRAIYPKGQSMAIVLQLQQAGAHSGLCEFTLPVFDPAPESNYFHASGQLKITVLEQLST
jgi:hypothetical protein